MTRNGSSGSVTDQGLIDQMDLLAEVLDAAARRWKMRADAGHLHEHPLEQVLTAIDRLEAARGQLVRDGQAPRSSQATSAAELREVRVEQELRRSEERFRLLVDGVRDYAIFMLDPEGRVVSWNAGAERMKGYRAEEIIGRHLAEFYTLEDRAAGRPEDNLRRASQQGSAHDEGWRVCKDGTEFFAEIVLTALRDHEGRLRGFAKVTRDVTERMHAEESRRFLYDATLMLATALELQPTLEHVSQLVVPRMADWCLVDLVNDSGEIHQVAAAHVDPAKARLARELARRHANQPELPHGTAHVIRTGRAEIYPDMTDTRWLGELLGAEHPQILRELGTRSYICAPLMARGRVLGAITFLRSMRGNRYQAAHLRDAEELGRRAGLLIDNARLYEQAQSAIQTRDEFLMIAAHELRTPVTTLQLGLDGLQRLLEKGPEAADARAVRHRFGSLQRQTSRLAHLVEGLLDVSRISAGHLRLQLEEVDLAEIVRDVLDDCQPDAARSGTEIQARLVAATGHWDRVRLHQITAQLVLNAIKYGRGAPVEVAVNMFEGQATLVVRDHGEGIAAEYLPGIFDRFARAAPVRAFGGLGLGLFITRQVAEAHGGSVRVESESGAGTTFTVVLPMDGGRGRGGAEHSRSTKV